VNTGWSGGGYGVGERMKIAHTRAMIRAILEGNLAGAPYAQHPNFGVLVPEACPDVPAHVLNPKNTWNDKAAYDAAAREVAKRFETNFAKFEPYVDGKVKAAAIHAAV
ncbi:MAG: phosphoenolpyruvate carboxykinase (ATP), partial [Rhodospirillaceae bacterium]|nr:phosphoenolpyruvate carboxykinase (ATP) [Rhodospirillaceae bacterium]